jgi:hypothetical protein
MIPNSSGRRQYSRYAKSPHDPAIGVIRERVNAQYSPRHYPPDTHHTRALLNAGVLVEQGQLTVPPQHQAHYFTQQKHFPNPAVQTRIENPAYTKLADGVSGQSHRYAPVDATLNLKVSSNVTAERRYFCSCGKDYSQPQGVLRHRRAAHNKPLFLWVADLNGRALASIGFTLGSGILKSTQTRYLESLLGIVAGPRSSEEI